MPGIEPGSPMFKANDLPTVLSLLPSPECLKLIVIVAILFITCHISPLHTLYLIYLRTETLKSSNLIT